MYSNVTYPPDRGTGVEYIMEGATQHPPPTKETDMLKIMALDADNKKALSETASKKAFDQKKGTGKAAKVIGQVERWTMRPTQKVASRNQTTVWSYRPTHLVVIDTETGDRLAKVEMTDGEAFVTVADLDVTLTYDAEKVLTWSIETKATTSAVEETISDEDLDLLLEDEDGEDLGTALDDDDMEDDEEA